MIIKPSHGALLLIVYLVLLPRFTYATDTVSRPVYKDTVASIIIAGNRSTKTEVIRQLAGITTGAPFDSSMLADIKLRLIRTNLFSKVDVFSMKTSDGYRLYIMLNEKFYLLPYDFGGELFSYRYGKREMWWRCRVGLEHSNFRGKAEVLRTSFSFWDWKSLGLGWTKPLLPSPYYFSLGMSADELPDEVFRINHTMFRGSATFGRKLPENSRVDLTVMPLYRRRITLDAQLSPLDTMRVYEAFSILKFRTDQRDRAFDPDKGWFFILDGRTNALYTRVAPQFFQLSGDFRAYFPGILPSHKLAMRSTATVRNADAGTTHRLLLGGEGSVRGYGRNQFGLYFYANNSVTYSCEYRFMLFQLPYIPLFNIDRLSPIFSNLVYRVDGAFMMDYGRITARTRDLFAPLADNMEQGTGIGGGLRIVFPTLEHSICYDLLWGTNPYSKSGFVKFMEQPAWHFYLDMYF